MSSQPALRNSSASNLRSIRQGQKALFFKIQNSTPADICEKSGFNMINQLQNQREQIARDLHDGIGSQLTHIISRLDIMAYNHKGLENQLASLRDFTRETVQQLRETIWVLNQPEITYGQLVERIKGLLSRMTEDMDYPKIEVDAAGNTSLLLTAPLTSSIFRIVQEAVNNALKYADACTIQIILKVTKTTLHIQINDNGKGFCFTEARQGYGLQNIRCRTEELEGQLLIDSSPEGTRIAASFPLH